nr:hypothetical protein [Tanacetum cinerariifolium]
MSSCCSSSSLSYTASISRPSSLSFTSATRSHISIPLTNRFAKFGVKCSYADAGVKDTSSSAIDVEADIKSDRLVVLGGSGFVGSAICKAAANIIAVNAAKEYGIPKFALISVHDYNIPSFLLTNGYFTGKRKAEAEVLSKYPSSGEPIERLLNATASFTKPLSSLPASDLILAPPVSVDDVALATINAVKDDDCFGVFTIHQIKEAAAGVKV